jgi:hypothetical protein
MTREPFKTTGVVNFPKLWVGVIATEHPLMLWEFVVGIVRRMKTPMASVMMQMIASVFTMNVDCAMALVPYLIVVALTFRLAIVIARAIPWTSAVFAGGMARRA